MKASEIQEGDTFIQDGVTLYTVIGTRAEEDGLYATVQYVDGGYGVRSWAFDLDVPLVRPEG